MGETWYLPRCPLSNSPQACPAASASRQPGQSLAAPSPASVTVSGPDKTASCDAPRCKSTLNPVCPTTEPLIMHTQPPDQKVPLEMKQKSHHTTMNYSAYGLHTDCGSAAPALAYNGEHHDPFSRLYLLGNGHRPYSSRLMRFNTSDSQSPFLLGGLNSYCYCNGDPINFSDPSGQMRTPLRPVNTPQRRYGGNPTLRESSRLRQRERSLRAQAGQARANARRETREAQAAAEREAHSRAEMNNTNNPIHREIFSSVADMNHQQRSSLLASSVNHWTHNLSLTSEAERLARTRIALLLTEYENVPAPQVNPPNIPAQATQMTTPVQTLGTLNRRTTVRGTNT
ncbi:RHS repeat-associated core domain-containing protein [Pseudomonas putida]|uniref:RHS repeat-associated core domain-containing protein n=2 Tax=Pseudomonas putida TaxID=303 RepID=A0A3M8TNU3_PSEPU|nr:RHS repeat-associated core domain-containing protein [Pseudomonas putida]